MAIQNEVDLPVGKVTHQSAEEVDEHRAGKRPGEQPEPQQPLARDRTEQVHPKPLAGPPDDRRVAHRRPRAARRRIRPHAHLVQPQHHPALPAGLGADGGILLLEPAAHRHRVLLQGAPLRLLRAQTATNASTSRRWCAPSGSHSAGRSARRPPPGSTESRQPELVRRAVPHQRDNLLLLAGGSAACSPARRPRRRCDSASQPPWRYCFIQRFTALGWTPNTRAASAWAIPSSTAWTARLRSAAWAAPARDRASSFDMPRAYDIPLYLPAGVISGSTGKSA